MGARTVATPPVEYEYATVACAVNELGRWGFTEGFRVVDGACGPSGPEKRSEQRIW
jgi:hypothetical protein